MMKVYSKVVQENTARAIDEVKGKSDPSAPPAANFPPKDPGFNSKADAPRGKNVSNHNNRSYVTYIYNFLCRVSFAFVNPRMPRFGQ